MRISSGLVLLLCGALLGAPSFATDTACCEAGGEQVEDTHLADAIAAALSQDEYVFASLAQGNHRRAKATAAAELIWQRVDALASTTLELRALAAEQLIDSYLADGLSHEAIALFGSLDPAVRERATHGPILWQASTRGGLEYSFQALEVTSGPALTAAGLALAYADAGQSAQAEALLQVAREFQPARVDLYDGDLGAPSAEAARCTQALIRPAAETDWFFWRFGKISPGGVTHESGTHKSGTHESKPHDGMAHENATHDQNPCARTVPARLFQRRAAERLAASGLPVTWRTGTQANECKGCSDSSDAGIDAALKRLPRIKARIAELRGKLAAIDRADAIWIALQKKAEDGDTFRQVQRVTAPSAADVALAAKLAQRLAQPMFDPYTIAPYASADSARAGSAAHAPCAKGVLRCTDSGAVRWELFVSQDYDPTGEVPAAGYWLRRTALPDGAPAAYYLGLKEHRPFELVDSDRPIVIGDELRLLVRRAPIDPNQIAFPPLGLQIAAQDATLELSAKLADIQRDSDGDGLTDLAEQQLLLDPHAADSDGDGIPDAADALPNVADAQHPTLRQQAFAAGLAYITREPDRAISFGVPASGAFVRRRSTDERTLYIEADPDDVAAAASERRIVVLPSSLDGKLLAKHPAFGVFYAMTLSLHMLGDGRHAELVYNAGWQGGTLALELRDGAWLIGSLSSWIT